MIRTRAFSLLQLLLPLILLGVGATLPLDGQAPSSPPGTRSRVKARHSNRSVTHRILYAYRKHGTGGFFSRAVALAYQHGVRPWLPARKMHCSLPSQLRVAALVVATLLVPHLACGQQTPALQGGVTLRPGDVIRVQIWREEDLSGEFLVDEDGAVTLPLIGEKRVTDRSLRQVRDALVEDYRVHLRNPAINITPLRRIHVLGEVNKPGVYAVDPTVTLAGAVATAEGATANGDIRRITIWRGGRVLRERAAPGETLSDVDIRSGDQIIVERRSWFERNSTFVVSALLSVTSVLITLLRS